MFDIEGSGMETLVTGIRQTDNARNQCERDIRIYFFRVRETRISIWMRCRGANAHRVTNEVQQILKYADVCRTPTANAVATYTVMKKIRLNRCIKVKVRVPSNLRGSQVSQ